MLINNYHTFKFIRLLANPFVGLTIESIDCYGLSTSRGSVILLHGLCFLLLSLFFFRVQPFQCFLDQWCSSRLLGRLVDFILFGVTYIRFRCWFSNCLLRWRLGRGWTRVNTAICNLYSKINWQISPAAWIKYNEVEDECYC